ncbi:MAG: glucosidase [Polyangiaceae bacterium]|nr:glucosidase [Polyangiaceae bacterium]
MSSRGDRLTHENPEEHRLHEERERLVRWKHWGPYLAERAWGTVREDYSPSGDAWNYFPHEQARSRTYRWNEDGLLGLCDRNQLLCIAPAFWNGQDPILKERFFGVSGPEGNHGEDVKELYYYEDATPTASYLKASYKYPQRPYPYAEIVNLSQSRSLSDPEPELTDLGFFKDDRYFEITIEYAKYSANDIFMVITAQNAGDSPAPLHILPHVWFRNTWSWTDPPGTKPDLVRTASQTPCLKVRHDDLGTLWAYFASIDVSSSGSLTSPPQLLFTHNETNTKALWGTPLTQPFVKDAFHRRVIHGDETAVNPAEHGTKAAAWYSFVVPPKGQVRVLVRLCPEEHTSPFDKAFELLASRRREADAYYRSVQGPDLSEERRAIHRQASAGLFWSLQFYSYDVSSWLDGDVHPPPKSRLKGRNREWRHLSVADVISMPDKWEYPWFAAWDLAFHALAMASVDIDQAKNQLKFMVKEWYQHPSGQIPAYEWELSDLNPPVQAWATYQIYKIERRQRGEGDRVFLERMFHKLLINFAWWVNKRDTEGNNVFEGGFLGLDNISLFDRSEGMPPGIVLEQADATAWMAMYCLDLMRIALELALTNTAYEDVASKFFEHFARIVFALNHGEYEGDVPLWSEDDGFYFDLLKDQNKGTETHLKVRSMVGLIPLCAVHVITKNTFGKLHNFRRRFQWFLNKNPHLAEAVTVRPDGRHVLSAIPPSRLPRVLRHLFNEAELLSSYGPRSLSKEHKHKPVSLWLEGMRRRGEVSYEPGESTTRMKGGNSNWRGPVWFPTGYLLYRSLLRLDHGFGDVLTIPAVSGAAPRTLRDGAEEIAQRLVRIFERGPDGNRPVYGQNDLFQHHPNFAEKLLFFEYFHGDTGVGLGASHQTGWSALVGDLVLRLQRHHGNTGSHED